MLRLFNCGKDQIRHFISHTKIHRSLISTSALPLQATVYFHLFHVISPTTSKELQLNKGTTRPKHRIKIMKTLPFEGMKQKITSDIRTLYCPSCVSCLLFLSDHKSLICGVKKKKNEKKKSKSDEF